MPLYEVCGFVKSWGARLQICRQGRLQCACRYCCTNVQRFVVLAFTSQSLLCKRGLQDDIRAGSLFWKHSVATEICPTSTDRVSFPAVDISVNALVEGLLSVASAILQPPAWRACWPLALQTMDLAEDAAEIVLSLASGLQHNLAPRGLLQYQGRSGNFLAVEVPHVCDESTSLRSLSSSFWEHAGGRSTACIRSQGTQSAPELNFSFRAVS